MFFWMQQNISVLTVDATQGSMSIAVDCNQGSNSRQDTAFMGKPLVTPYRKEANGKQDGINGTNLYTTVNEKVKSTIRYLNSPSKRSWYLDQISSLRAHVIQQASSGAENELNTNPTGVVSLPSFDKASKSKIICTPGSPPRKRGRRCVFGS